MSVVLLSLPSSLLRAYLSLDGFGFILDIDEGTPLAKPSHDVGGLGQKPKMGSVLTLRALPFPQVAAWFLVQSPSIRPTGDKRPPPLLLPKLPTKLREVLGVGLELAEEKVKPGVSPKLILKSKSGLVGGVPICCPSGVVLFEVLV